MKTWFEALQVREQWFVGVGGVVVVLTLLWGVLWVPFDKGHRELRSNIDVWERSLNELKPLRAAIQSGANPRAVAVENSNETPVVVVDQTLRARGLNGSLKRRQPTPNGIRVEFEDIAFDDLVLWLGDLSTRYSMEVQAGSMSVANRAGPGRINASLTLERSL
jgi:type II secretory pathway component PulM